MRMNILLTAKLKLVPPLTSSARCAPPNWRIEMRFHYVSAYSFAHRKTSSGKRLQRATCADIRSRYALPSQMACNVPRQMGATYKSLWTKAKQNAEARRLGYTKWRGVRLDKAPHYVSPTLTYNLGRDYSLQSGQQVSLLTLRGRIHVPYQGWTRHVALLQAGAIIGG